MHQNNNYFFFLKVLEVFQTIPLVSNVYYYTFRFSEANSNPNWKKCTFYEPFFEDEAEFWAELGEILLRAEFRAEFEPKSKKFTFYNRFLRAEQNFEQN